MPREFDPTPGAAGFQLSNPPVLPIMQIRAALDLHISAGMDRLRAKALLLTGYLEVTTIFSVCC